MATIRPRNDWPAGTISAAMSATGTVSGSGGGPGDIAEFQLATNHFATFREAFTLVSPLPNASLPTVAHNIVCPQNFKFQTRIKCIGGTGAYMSRLTQGPTGATCGGRAINSWSGLEFDGTRRAFPAYATNTGAKNRYGLIEYTHSGGVTTETFTQESRDQLGNTVSSTFTVTFDDSLFVFLSTTGNDTTGDGSRSAPFRSFAPIANSASGTYANRAICLLDTGNFQLAATDTHYRVQSNTDYPRVIIGNPDATPRVQMPSVWFQTFGGIADMVIKGCELEHTTATADSQKMLFASGDRSGIEDCRIVNFELGNGTGGNGAVMLIPNAINPKLDCFYWAVEHAGQCGAAFVSFESSRNAIGLLTWPEPCTFSQYDGSNIGTIHLKDTTFDSSLDFIDFRCYDAQGDPATHTYGGAWLADVSWRGQGNGTRRVQIRYCYLTGPTTSDIRAASLRQGVNTPGEPFEDIDVQFCTINSARLEINNPAIIIDQSYRRDDSLLYGDTWQTDPDVIDTNIYDTSDGVAVDGDLYPTDAFLTANGLTRGQQGAELV